VHYGKQRPLQLQEFAAMTAETRAKITLSPKMALLCESCGWVYIDLGAETVFYDRLPIAGQP
jgi:hypothetical protein